MSTVPSGVLPLTASGPSWMFPVQAARYNAQALASAIRLIVDLTVPSLIRFLLVGIRGECAVRAFAVSPLAGGCAETDTARRAARLGQRAPARDRRAASRRSRAR